MESRMPQGGQQSCCFTGFVETQDIAHRQALQQDSLQNKCTDVTGAKGFRQEPASSCVIRGPDWQGATSATPVQVKRVTTTVFAAPRLAPTYVDVPVPIYVPRYVEVPVPVAKLDAQVTKQLQQYQ